MFTLFWTGSSAGGSVGILKSGGDVGKELPFGPETEGPTKGGASDISKSGLKIFLVTMIVEVNVASADAFGGAGATVMGSASWSVARVEYSMVVSSVTQGGAGCSIVVNV